MTFITTFDIFGLSARDSNRSPTNIDQPLKSHTDESLHHNPITMKADSKLRQVFDKAKGDAYYSFEDFKHDAKAFLKDVRNTNTVCSMRVSSSGMTRWFNFKRYNMLLNIIYNQKLSWDPVKVQGCGMDMHWHLKWLSCEELATKGELEKHSYNMQCSFGSVL